MQKPSKRVAESPLNGPWDRVYSNSEAEVRYRGHPRERILVTEVPGGSRSNLRIAVFDFSSLDGLQLTYGWVLDKLGFHGGKLPAGMGYDKVVRSIKTLVTSWVQSHLRGWAPDNRRPYDAALAQVLTEHQVGALQFYPHGRGETQLIGMDFDLRSDPTYFKVVSNTDQSEITNRGPLAALALYAIITGSDLQQVRLVRREIEGMHFAQVPQWLTHREIPHVLHLARAASRQAAEGSLSLVGRGFSLEMSAGKFEASSTLAEDVEESFTVRSLDKDAAARLWGILHENAVETPRLTTEIEQLDFAELPGWLRKKGVKYDLERSWQDLAPKEASRQAAVPLGGRWDGSVANPNVEVRWSTSSGHESIAVIEQPKKGMRKVRVASFDLNYGPGTLYAANVLRAAGLEHGIPFPATYEKVRTDVVHARIRDAERSAANPHEPYADRIRGQISSWHQHPYWETEVNARLVLPANAPTLSIQAQDFTFVSKPYEFSARMYYGDPGAMEPSYTDLDSTSEWMALSLYKRLTGPGGEAIQQAIRGLRWNGLRAFLAKLGIASEQHSSQYRAGALVLRDRSGRSAVFPRAILGGFRPEEVLMHAGFEYGIPPSKTLRAAVREVRLALKRLDTLRRLG